MLDYSKLGFKCGLEIHQQLQGRKLFCHCPSINSDKKPDIKIMRKLRASAGETGKIDIAAKHEVSKDKYFLYEGNSEDVCLVELDEEPVHEVSKEALDTAIVVARLLNAKIVDEIQFMRKTVVDGSNTSAFQRTALIAQDGYIETSKGRVKVDVICLEEEAAQRLSESKEYVRYKLDRLGIPLIEIGTDASIKDPEHAKEVAEKLGMILRSTGKVKRGIGTIRQDVNVSISKGARTEIKGFQDLKSIPKVIDFEIQRQLREIKNGKKIQPAVRKAEENLTTSYLRPMPGAARMYVETDSKTIPVTSSMFKVKLPELLTEKSKKLEKFGLSKDISNKISKSGGEDYFISMFKSMNSLKPSFIVDTFSSVRQELKKIYSVDDVSDEEIKEILQLVNNGKIPKNNLAEALADKVKGKLKLDKFKGTSDKDLEKEIEKIVKEKPGLSHGAYMGLIMKKFSGKVDGKKAMEILKKFL